MWPSSIRARAKPSTGGGSSALLVQGLEGAAGNVYDVAVSARETRQVAPEGLEIFAYRPVVRVPDQKTFAQLRFRPPAGADRLVVHGFDLAHGSLQLTTAFSSLPLKASGQDEWATTEISPVPGTPGAEAALDFGRGVEMPNDATFMIADAAGAAGAVRASGEAVAGPRPAEAGGRPGRSRGLRIGLLRCRPVRRSEGRSAGLSLGLRRRRHRRRSAGPPRLCGAGPVQGPSGGPRLLRQDRRRGRNRCPGRRAGAAGSPHRVPRIRGDGRGGHVRRQRVGGGQAADPAPDLALQRRSHPRGRQGQPALRQAGPVSRQPDGR